MKSIFVIHQIEFLSTLIDVAMVKSGVHTFTHTNTDCIHYIRDFAPDLLLIDYETIEPHRDSFLKEVSLLSLPVVSMGRRDFGEFASQYGLNYKGHFSGAIKPLEIHKALHALLVAR